MNTGVIIGRFQPITIIHKQIINDAIKQYDRVVVVVVNSKKSIIANSHRRLISLGRKTIYEEQDVWNIAKKYKGVKYSTKSFMEEKLKNPFPGKIRKNILREIFDDIVIISHNSANIEQIVNKIYNNEDIITIICGSDREKMYQYQITDANKKGFFPYGLTVNLSVIDRKIDVSATQIREAIVNDNIKKFKELTPSEEYVYYDKLRRILCST